MGATPGMGPSLGAINRAILLAADYFVVPMSIDIFSLWAIRNIGETVAIWQRDLKNGLQLAEDPNELPNVAARPRLNFLGYVTQQHKETSQAGSRKVVEAYDAIRRRLPSEVQDKLGTLYADPGINPHLGDVKHLSSLAPKSQTMHTPMISIKMRGSFTSLRKQAREIYEAMSTRFLENVEISEKSRR